MEKLKEAEVNPWYPADEDSGTEFGNVDIGACIHLTWSAVGITTIYSKSFLCHLLQNPCECSETFRAY